MYDDILNTEERYALTLRRLYHSYGYQHKHMSRFESYDFYAGKKDFLISPSVFTFTDTDGKLMALRPDITLSLVARINFGKYYYDETVYRADENSGKCVAVRQVGIEYIGGLTCDDIAEVLRLSVESLREICGHDGHDKNGMNGEKRNYALDVADAGMVKCILPKSNGGDMLKCLHDKNIHGLKELNAPQELMRMAEYPGLDCLSDDCASAVNAVNDSHIVIDFSAVNNLKYYDGLVLKGYIDGIPKAVLSGGQYNIAGKIGAGFAVYLDRIGGVIGD